MFISSITNPNAPWQRSEGRTCHNIECSPDYSSLYLVSYLVPDFRHECRLIDRGLLTDVMYKG